VDDHRECSIGEHRSAAVKVAVQIASVRYATAMPTSSLLSVGASLTPCWSCTWLLQVEGAGGERTWL
jgi:hypothetical protein